MCLPLDTIAEGWQWRPSIRYFADPILVDPHATRGSRADANCGEHGWVTKLFSQQAFGLKLLMDEDEKLLALYTQNAEIAHAYIDWRIRVISLYFSSLGAVFVGAGWVFNTVALKSYVWVPFAFGALTSVLFFWWNETISNVLQITNNVGADIEGRLTKVPGCYTQLARWLSSKPGKYVSSAFIWRMVFLLSVPTFIAIAVASPSLDRREARRRITEGNRSNSQSDESKHLSIGISDAAKPK